MAFCRQCGANFLDEHLNRDHLCADCAKALSAERRLSQKKERNRKKTCLRCGAHGLFLYIDPEGYCENCRPKVDAERKAQRRSERLAQNYQSCQNGTARPGVQRIYSAFRAKYPDALIAGIETKNGGNCLIVHLDGGDKYNVVFNALTNDVDVLKIGDSSVNDQTTVDDHRYVSSPEKNKKGGCLSILFKTICWVAGLYFALIFFIAFFSVILNNDYTGKTASTPAPTSTAPADDVVAWVSYYAELGVADNVSFRTVEETTSAGQKILVVKFFLSPMSKEKYYRVAAAQTIIQVGESIRNGNYHKGYDSVNFLFYGGFIDQYGNRKESLGIRAWYTTEELSLLNFDYFESSVYHDPDAIIKASDDYIIHPAYQK